MRQTMPQELHLRIVVFNDAAMAEILGAQQSQVGYFEDEVEALSAVCERVLIQSAILPQLRKLPQLRIDLEYRKERCNRSPQVFSKGIAVKDGQLGRKVVMLPGASAKQWFPAETTSKASWQAPDPKTAKRQAVENAIQCNPRRAGESLAAYCKRVAGPAGCSASHLRFILELQAIARKSRGLPA